MSLYIQLTTRCNMRCAHCGFACTERGSDMSRDTFNKALQLAIDFQTYITLGGGEPLLHPLFFDFAWQSIRALLSLSEDSGFSGVGVVTNGKCESESCELALMAKQGFISARLSLDPYHEPITERVKRAFGWREPSRGVVDYNNPQKRENDLRCIGGANGAVIAAGRARTWGDDPLNRRCFCDDILIVPSGKIYHCGCKRVSYGNINDPDLSLPEFFTDILSEGGCSRTFDPSKIGN